MVNEIPKWRLLLLCFLMVAVSIFNGAGVGYFTPFFDVWEGAVLFGVFLGIIPVILIWKYISRRVQIV